MLAHSDAVLPPASKEILLRPDFTDRLEIVADSAVGLLRAHGAAALTFRRIAADCEMSIGWLTNRFDDKDHLLALITLTVGERWLQWINSRADEAGTLALLPEGADEVPALEVWLTLVELGRFHAGAGEQTVAVRAHERAWVASLLRRGPDHHPGVDEVATTMALVDGLRLAVVADGLSTSDARRLLLPQQGVVRSRAGVA